MKLLISTSAAVLMSLLVIPAFAAELVGGSANNDRATVTRGGFSDCTTCEAAVVPGVSKQGLVSFNTNQGAYTAGTLEVKKATTAPAKAGK